MKKTFILVLIIPLLLLTSCYSYDNISETLFVNTVGIDYDNEKNEYIVYYHMTNPSTLTTEALGGSSEENTFSIAKGKSDTILKAMQIISSNSNKRIKLTHVKTYLFSLNYLKYENLKKFHEFIKTSPYLYSDFRILITDSDIEEIFKFTDIENTSPYYSLIVSSNDSEETYKMTTLIDFSRGINEDYYGLSFPFVRATKDVWETQKEEIYSLKIEGSIFINKDDNILLLEEDKYPIIFLLKTKKNASVIIDDYHYLMTRHKYKVKHLEDNNFLIKIKVIAYITQYGKANHDIKELFINHMKNSLDELIIASKENDVDIFSVKNILYRKGKLKSAFNYKDANFIYDFDVKIISII